MSIGEVQARIGQIQSVMIAAAGAARPAAATATRQVTASGSAGQFADALRAAVAAAGTGATGSPTAAPLPPVTPAGTWIRPADGQVSSGFGPRWGTMHEGMDIAAGSGSPVRAATTGVVRKASWYGGYGNAVIIDHGNGVKTLYGHNSKLLVKPGDRVEAGQVIAKVGSTGDSTGPHLHFEVQVDGEKINPRPWLKKHGVTF